MNQTSSTPWGEPSMSAAPADSLAEQGEQPEDAPSPEPAGGRSVVLIVTGRLQVRAVGTTVLRQAGFRVEVASSGQEVIAGVEELLPDVILAEASLDDMTAAHLCSQVRGLPEGKAIPFLVISDFSDPRDIQNILSEDLTDIVAAPVNWKVLTFRIHRWISMAKRFHSLSDHHDLDFEEVRESALKASTELLQLRNYDSLTGLPNREMFVDSLELVLAQRQRSSGYCAVLYLDIDDFQGVNDLIGRSLGDELLRLVARRLQGCLRQDDLVSQMGDEGSLVSFARVNADEFAILLSSVPNQATAAAVAKRLMASLAQPLSIRDREFRLSARVGIADSLSLDAESEVELLQRAEIAMRYCKQHEGTAVAVFETFMNDLVVKKLELKAELRKALERKELFLCYQLLVDARTATPQGVEGLVRWNHPARGLVSPNEFLPVAEESDLMVEIDRWVLRDGCRQGKAWLDQDFPPLLISLNVSMRFLAEADFAEQVLTIVEETGLPPASLQLELSERGNLPDAGRIMGQFEKLVDRGIKLALDDFGTGQTSLSYLRTLPISCVKVDQSFVRRVPNDSASAAIVTAIVAMSHHLGLKVVAEGVETTEHWRFLSENGYDQLQGYLFSRPERVEEIETGFRNLNGWREMIAAKGLPTSAPTALGPNTGVASVSPPLASGPPAAHLATAGNPLARRAADEWQGSEADLLELARNDFLTKLYNRFSFDERLEHAVAHADRFGHKVALLLIDMDDFKYVNDTHGHAVGDALLVAIAQRLKKLVRKVDTLARIGGDEFAVILSEFQDVKHVADFGARLLQVLAQQVVVEGRELRVTGSLGISIYPAGSTQAKDLLRQADLALYKGKKHGGNSVRFFAREMDWEVKRRLALAHDLVGAVDRDELFLEYQLQIALATGAIVGAEALLRWDHPSKGLIGPERLIPIAESTGEIRAIGRWVLRSACAQVKAWQKVCGRDIPVSVNLSPVQCRDPEFVDDVLLTLKEQEMAPQLLHLELNEGLLTQLPQKLEDSLRRLGERGVSLTLDNFGSGVSALEHFQRFQFNRLKIHQSLVRTVGERSSSSSVLGGIFALARQMKVQIVAEGVEKPEEARALLAEGCEIGQGFLFSKPRLADTVLELIRGPGVLTGYVPPSAVEAFQDSSASSDGSDADGSEVDVSEVDVSEADADEAEPAAERPAFGLAEKLASLTPEAAEPPSDTATAELRKLDSYSATASRRGSSPWQGRVRVAVMIAAVVASGAYFLPWKMSQLQAYLQQVVSAEPGPASGVPTAKSAAATTQPANEPAGAKTTSVTPPAVLPAGAKPSPRPGSAPPSPRTAGKPDEAIGAEQPLLDIAQAWARAWSEQRVDDYLDLYARGFRPLGGLDRDAWQAQRRVRILKPRRIEVQLSAVEVEWMGTDRGQVSFEQSYRSDGYSDSVRKTLELIRERGGWKILAERVES